MAEGLRKTRIANHVCPGEPVLRCGSVMNDGASNRSTRTEAIARRRIGTRASYLLAATTQTGWLQVARWRITKFIVVLGLVVTVVWSVTGASYFWPGWVWFGLLLPYASLLAIRVAIHASKRPSLAVHGALALILAATGIFIWLMGRLGYFWPMWLILGFVITLAVHVWVVPLFSNDREKVLERRVDVLTRTRRGALDVQEAEMRRVERDLHDGAQARLVSLGMSLGLADELLDSDPIEARRLLREARTGAVAALADLRSLVRGIYPPVLADRGLDGAIQALVLAVPLPVEMNIDLPSARLPPPVESAAYFAVAEALANVVKHSDATHAWIEMGLEDGNLIALVGDDGNGGADANCGTGLLGIERRLVAFDGTLQISSPMGGPTIISMAVPCES